MATSLVVNGAYLEEKSKTGGRFRAHQPRKAFGRLRRRCSRPCLKALLDQVSGLDKEKPGTAVGADQVLDGPTTSPPVKALGLDRLGPDAKRTTKLVADLSSAWKKPFAVETAFFRQSCSIHRSRWMRARSGSSRSLG